MQIVFARGLNQNLPCGTLSELLSTRTPVELRDSCRTKPHGNAARAKMGIKIFGGSRVQNLGVGSF